MKIENIKKEEMLSQNIYELVRIVLDRYDIEYAQDGLDANLQEWLVNKKELITLLRKHPNWNEDELAIVFKVTQKREVEYNKVFNLRDQLCSMADEIIMNIIDRQNFKTSLFYLTNLENQYIDEHIAKKVQVSSKISCASGQKTSRVINKLCKKYCVDMHPEYNAHFSKLADALNPLQIKRKALLSIHPGDYLEMSNKSNSWCSCHRLTGEYAAGTLSYMNDSVTMIFYTVDNGVEQSYYKAPKINREVFCYQNGVLLQSRLYPNYSDEDTQTDFRNIVQTAMAVCEKKPNLWSIKKTMDDVEKHVHTYEDSLHYADYEHDQYNSHISLLKEIEDVEHNSIIVGNPAYCLECGDELDRESELLCDFCNDTCRCNDCGRIIDEDFSYEVNGYNYCLDCVEHCEDCGEYFRGDVNHVIDDDGIEIDVCDDCGENYFPCENCNGYFHRGNLEEFNDYNYCPVCLEKVQEENVKEIKAEYELNCSNLHTV